MSNDNELSAASHKSWGTATLFTYTHSSHDLCSGLLSALLPLIKEGLGLSYLQSGFLLSAYTITSGLSQIPGGWLGDRVRKTTVLAVALGGVGLSTLAVGLSPSYYPMLAILVVMGLFAGGYHPSAVPILSGYYEEARRGRVIALHMVGGSIGFSIGPLLGGLIADHLGWRFAFVILSIPALFAVPLIFKKFGAVEKLAGMTSSQRPVSNGQTPAESHRMSIGEVLRPLAVILVLCVTMQLIAGVAMSFAPLYLVDKHGIAPASAAVLVGIMRFGGIGGSLLGGWLSDRWGRKQAIFVSLVSTGPALYLITVLPYSAALVLFLIIFGMSRYMTQATMQPYLMSKTPAYVRGTIFGIYFGLGMEGQSLIQPVAGHFMDIYGITGVFAIIAIVSAILSLVTLLLAKKA